MTWKEIGQETRKKIVLSLRGGFLSGTVYKGPTDLAKEFDLAKSTISQHLHNLNDFSVVHQNRKGYHLIPNRVRFKRATDKYVTEFLIFVPSAFLFSILAIYLSNQIYRTGLVIGFFTAFLPVFIKKLYDVLSEEDYIRVFRKEEKNLEDSV